MRTLVILLAHCGRGFPPLASSSTVLLSLIFSIGLTGIAVSSPTPPDPTSVAVVFNASSPDSRALAEFYIKARKIPAENLVGLELPDTEEISRDDYNQKLRDPLIREFNTRQWWVREPDSRGRLLPTQSVVRILVTIRGVPSRVAGSGSNLSPPEGERPFDHTTQAAVDSELAHLGIEGVPIEGIINNSYYNQDKTVAEARLPILLVGRIDGPTREICARMIMDAVEVEKTGLWGMSVVDIAQKFGEVPEGDPALEKIAASHRQLGIPVMVDRFPETLPANFPLSDTALYFGWYSEHMDGPFINPAFKFRKGAVAAHLHSFSAAQLRDPTHNWSAPLLAKGAAATIGNVYEPFLQLTHNFHIFNERLLAGYSLVEAAYMSLPVLSWQNIVLGDPLYRPFIHLNGTGVKAEADREFRALRIARQRWREDDAQYMATLRDAGDRTKSGLLLEAAGLVAIARKDLDAASLDLRKAKLYYESKPDRLRMDLHLASANREAGNTTAAIDLLRGARTLYLDIPEATAAAYWLALLDPSQAAGPNP